MLKPTEPCAVIFLALFLLFSLANLLALATDTAVDNYLTKPFLMVWLGLYVYARLPYLPTTSGKWLLLGLFFSFLGDTLLLFADGRPSGGTFFLLGLGSFLLTHVAYWLAFHFLPGQQVAQARYFWQVLPLLVYWSILTYLLVPNLPAAMVGPVLLYSLVIIAMAAKSISILPCLQVNNGRMLVAGVLLFVLSDTIIALSRFTDYLPFNGLVTGLAIMLTYLIGQLLIVLGLSNAKRIH